MTLEQKMARELDGHFWTLDYAAGRTIDAKAAGTHTTASTLADPDAWATYLLPKEKAAMEPILRLVAKFYGVPVALICGPMKLKPYVRARLATTYLARDYSGLNNVQIAAAIGYASHEGVSRAISSVMRKRSNFEPELSRCIAELQHKSIQEPQSAASPHPLAVEATGAVPQEASAPVAPISRVLP